MRITIKYITVTCIFAMLHVHIYGQQGAKEWIQKANNLLKNNSYRSSLKIDIYAGGVGGKLVESNQGSIMKNALSSSVQMGKVLTLQSSAQTLIIDAQHWEMILVNQATPVLVFDFAKDFDTYSKHLDTTYLTSDAGLITIVSIFNKTAGNMYSRIDTKINTITGLPTQITIYYSNTIPGYDYATYKSLPVMQISYSNWELNPTFDASAFDFNKYLVLKNNAWVTTTAFKNYELTILN